MIDTPTTYGATGTAIRGFLITGKNLDGSFVAGTSGVRIRAGTKNSIDQTDFDSHDGPAIEQLPVANDAQGNPIANGTLSITNVTAQACFRTTRDGLTVPTGVFDLHGTNGEVHWCEVSGSSTTRSTNGYQVSILIGGADCALSNVLGEFSDINWYFAGTRIFGVNLTGDNSAIHNYVFSDCTDTRISGLATRTGQHPKVTGGIAEDCNAVHVIGTSLRNVVSLHVTLPGDTKATHAVYETLNAPYAEYKNDFTGCLVARMSDGSMAVSGVPYVNAYPGGGSPMPAQRTCQDVIGPTPDVNGLGFIRKIDDTPPTQSHLTSLANGTAGQRVSVLFTYATLVVHNTSVPFDSAALVLNGATNRTAPSNSIITFKNYNGVWYEEGGRAIYNASAGWTPGAIGSGAAVSRSVTVPGAVVGDFAVASLSYTGAYLITSAQVISPDTVRVSISNLTGGSVTVPALTVYVRVDARN